MSVKNQIMEENFVLYNGDCIEVMSELESGSIDFSIYSPPFSSMYTYSSSDRDLGNNKTYEEFLEHYEFVIKDINRLTKSGRLTAVHCMDIPKSGDGGLIDFPGDIIRLHEKNGFKYFDRKNIWKEPLRVAIRTRQRALMHQQVYKDSLLCRGALADYLLIFKKIGENKIPVHNKYGFEEYFGDIELMNEIEKKEYMHYLNKYVKYTDDKTNKLSQFIWRRYASSSWEDVRANECLCYKPARDKEDDRHVCPLQLDIVRRSVELYTNKDEIVLTPFMGIGSEVYAAVELERKGIGIELKESYFNQAYKNLKEIKKIKVEIELFDYTK